MEPNRRKVLILGAAGRDFHDFNVIFRDDPHYEVVAVTAAQIPNIDGRCYPAQLAGKLYPEGIQIVPEVCAWNLVREIGIDEVILAYSDLSHEEVMHKAARAVALGASFRLLGADETMLHSSKPVLSACAVRTGCGKSAMTLKLAGMLRAHKKRVAVIRHPMPYGDLAAQAVQRFATLADLESQNCTIEEREEYEPHIADGDVVFAGVDYERVLRAAEAEADVILWDGGNNDLPFIKPNLELVLADPHRAGHETRYWPGEANLLRADAVVITKTDTAPAGSIERLLQNIAAFNPKAAIIETAMPFWAQDPHSIEGKRVLCIEDGPTLTHGEMSFGVASLAASHYGAASIVDPRPFAVGGLKQAFEQYGKLGSVLPALGYSPKQLVELEATIAATPCDVVLIGTPVDLARLIKIEKPSQRIRYYVTEREGAQLGALVARFLKRCPE
jgi:predicted GTPase